MRVFLAGATGVVGRALIPQLLEAGHEVTALARTPAKAKALQALGVETAIADAFDAEASSWGRSNPFWVASQACARRSCPRGPRS